MEVLTSELIPNSIPEKPWSHIAVDFIVKLPEAQECNVILVVCDCLTKIAHFIATTEKMLAGRLAKLFRDHMWKLHGLSESIILDRGAQFVSRLMRELSNLLEIQMKLSIAYYPQMNGQTERIN